MVAESVLATLYAKVYESASSTCARLAIKPCSGASRMAVLIIKNGSPDGSQKFSVSRVDTSRNKPTDNYSLLKTIFLPASLHSGFCSTFETSCHRKSINAHSPVS